MKKAIVFGANGYIGRHIAYFLNKNNIDFISTDFAETSVDNFPNYISIDITNRTDLQKIDYQVDYIFIVCRLDRNRKLLLK